MMNPEVQNILLEFIVAPIILGIVFWLVWLTKIVNKNITHIAINTALDKQAQSTLTEIKKEMSEFRKGMENVNISITKILTKLDIE